MTVTAEENRLIEALRDVEDPELPISIVDMGLVVGLQKRDECVDIQITLTSMGCPAIDMITDDIRDRLLREHGVSKVRVEVVWDPIWTKARLSEDGKAALRECGISV